MERPADVILLRRSARGDEMLGLSADILGRMRAAWVKEIGLQRIRALEDDLERIAASGSTTFGNLPGWIR